MENNNAWENQFRLIILSLPDREFCVCEIYYHDAQWVELRLDSDGVIAQFYSHPSEICWEFPLEVATQILEKARKKLCDL